MFRRNCGTVDRAVRFIAGVLILLVGMFLLGGVHGDLNGVVAAVFGGFMLATAVSGFCILYVPFGISTLEKKKGIPLEVNP
ncbi:MAG: DUF2892 domain-containing protein [Chloroflexi bacterium]|nr:DUF2892 domain-containing protein [Chloroflexota bacterium]